MKGVNFRVIFRGLCLGRKIGFMEYLNLSKLRVSYFVCYLDGKIYEIRLDFETGKILIKISDLCLCLCLCVGNEANDWRGGFLMWGKIDSERRWEILQLLVLFFWVISHVDCLATFSFTDGFWPRRVSFLWCIQVYIYI